MNCQQYVIIVGCQHVGCHAVQGGGGRVHEGSRHGEHNTVGSRHGEHNTEGSRHGEHYTVG